MFGKPKKLHSYMEADRIALGISRIRPKFFGDEVWKFQRALRCVEYYESQPASLLNRIKSKFYHYLLHRYSLLCDFTISPNCFGAGLSIAHRGTIIVNSRARIGKNCRLHVGVVIGGSGGDNLAVPRIGDGVYIGPGAKIFGAIRIANDVSIGANAVVNKSVLQPGVTVAGVPAKIVKQPQSANVGSAAL